MLKFLFFGIFLMIWIEGHITGRSFEIFSNSFLHIREKYKWNENNLALTLSDGTLESIVARVLEFRSEPLIVSILKYSSNDN